MEEKKGELGEGGKGLGEEDLEGRQECLQKRSPLLCGAWILCALPCLSQSHLCLTQLLPLAVSTRLRRPKGVASGRR